MGFSIRTGRRRIGAKLHIDFPLNSSMCARMDVDASPTDWQEIIVQLCLEAGRLMEDTSDELARALPAESHTLDQRLQTAREAADDITALLAAAQTLRRRCLGPDGRS
jgi:hypothetical protein